MGGRVVVVGAVNVDLVVAAERLPGPGETVVGPRVEHFGGGRAPTPPSRPRGPARTSC